MDRSAVVILNYNGLEYLRQFLPSVVNNTSQSHVVVIDNHSQDHSATFVRQQYPQVQLVELEQNYGFSGGYNRGLPQVNSEYWILLNSDVEVTPNWDQPLITYLDENDHVGIVQPAILSYQQKDRFDYAGAAGGQLDFMGYPFCRGRLFHTLEKNHGQYQTNQDIFWAGGACMAVRADLFKSLGGFDEDFFAHMEEIDLCWRCHLHGMKVGYVATSQVYHVGGGTLTTTNPRKTYLNFRNGLSLLLKNSTPTQTFWKIPLRVFLDIIAALRFLLTGSLSHFWAVIRALAAFFVTIPHTMGKRQKPVTLKPGLLYNRMIVWDYFVKGKKTYGELTVDS